MPEVPRGLLIGPLSAQSKGLIQTYLATIPRRATDDDSDIVLGEASHRYRLLNDWAKLPSGWSFYDVASIAVDASDRVYVFSRGEHPVLIFDRDGNFLDHWGEGVFTRAHGIHIGPDGMLYLVDDGDHSVRKCTPQGKILMTIGTPGKPAPFMSGDPFCRCTDVALSPNGDIYVSDGYYNARIHKYTPDGRLARSWGEPGIEHGQFNIPHNVHCDSDGWVYVADRESHRVQIFDGNGRYETQWTNVHRPNALDQGKGGSRLFYVGEGGPHLRGNRHIPNLGPRVSVLSSTGETVARLGNLPGGDDPDRFLSPHGIAVDSHGDIYVGEVSYSVWPSAYPDRDVPDSLRTLRKLVRIEEP